MGWYQIANKNCLEVLKKLPNESINAIISDPPYIISRTSNFANGGGWNNPDSDTYRQTPPKTDFGEWDKIDLNWNELFLEFYRILKPSGTCLLFYDMWKMQELKECAESHKFKQPRLCRWDKTNPIPINSKLNYLSNGSEYFVTFVKGSKPTFNSEYDKGVYQFPICGGAERTEHPTQKPMVLMSALICKHTNQNDIVLDPFMGSGTTGLAALKYERNFVGCEIDKKFFDIAEQRIKNRGKNE